MNTKHLRPLAVPALLLLAATACTAKAEPTPTTPAAAPAKHAVKFEAFVPDGANAPTAGEAYGFELPAAQITLADHRGTEQIDATLPLTAKNGETGLTMTYAGSGAVVLSVQNKTSTGAVACRITVDGSVSVTKSATSDYGIAMCKASY